MGYESAWHNAGAILNVYRRLAGAGRAYFFLIGDSNAGQNGFGWDEGWHRGFIENGVPSYSTGLMPINSGGSAIGYGFHQSLGGTTELSSTGGMPAAWANLLTPHEGADAMGSPIAPMARATAYSPNWNGVLLYGADRSNSDGSAVDHRLAFDWHIWRAQGTGSVVANARRGSASQYAQWYLRLTGATGGTFTITYNSVTSAAITFNSDKATLATNIQTALEAMASIGAGNVTVAAKSRTDVGGSGTTDWDVNHNGYLITAAGTLTQARPAMSVDGGNLTMDPAVTPDVSMSQPNPGTSLGSYAPEITTNWTQGGDGSNAATVIRDSRSIAADSSRWWPVNFAYSKQLTTVTPPVCILGMAMEHVDRLYGYAFSTLMYNGGNSLRRFAQRIATMTTAWGTFAFGQARWFSTKVSQSPCVVFVINSGANDQTDANNSVGPSPAASNTQAGFYDNMVAVYNKIKSIWDDPTNEAAGWDFYNEVYFVVEVSHLMQSGDANMAPFRAAAQQFADAYPNTAYCDLSALATLGEMQLMWLNGPSDAGADDTFHLKRYGYVYLGNRRYQGLMTACRSQIRAVARRRSSLNALAAE